MLSGGEALEATPFGVPHRCFARSPSACRRSRIGARRANGRRPCRARVQVGDTLVIFPHDICPVDGIVTEGRGVMDESFLTGEPFQMSKTPGSRSDLRCDQWRSGADDSSDPSGRRLALREDHAGHARCRTESPADAATGRHARCLLHAAGGADRAGCMGQSAANRIGFWPCSWWRRLVRC